MSEVSDGETASRGCYVYRISGLIVRSDLELPSAFLAQDAASVPDVCIGLGMVGERLEGRTDGGPDWEIAGSAFLLRVTGVARFLIEEGRSIRFDPAAGSDPGDISLYLVGACLAVLLQQRGCLVLHASAIAVGDQAVLFCGQSGAGKSTMAALLCERGYTLLNDDTCSVTLDAEGRLVVSADGRMLKLWAKSLEHLSLRERTGPAVRRATDKYYLAPEHSDSISRPVAAVYLLEASEGEQVALADVNRLEGMTAIRESAFRPALVEAMGLEGSFFRTSANLLGQAKVYRLVRPMDFTRAEEVMTLLENHWNTIWGE